MRFFSFLTLFIFLGIVGFLSMEFIFNLKPCKLCFFQRIPFYIGFALCIMGFIFRSFQRHILLILAIMFAFNAWLAVFHFFVEEGLFTFECTSTAVGTIEELRRSLLETPSCSVKNYFLGVRITVLSFLYSAFLTIASTFCFVSKKKIFTSSKRQ